ncbi:UPF0182 family protein [Nocardioides sp.]|uniref:UPF0182 family membrane protein n=1 Tax=Nocardioides sp. TaxID=35761 RepID=UPI003527C79A
MSELFEEPARTPEPQGPSRRSRALLWTAGILAVGFVALSTFASLWTERMWFQSVSYGEVWGTMLGTRVLLFIVFGAVMAGAIALNAALAYRWRPVFRSTSPEQANLDRYREAIVPARRWLVIGLSVFIGLFAGSSAVGEWRNYLLWRHAKDFGETDPFFHHDLGFYIFQLPWLHYLVDFVMAVTAVSLVVATIVHYLFGGIQLQSRRDRFSPAAQGQLSVLVGLFVLAKAADYWLGRYDLLNHAGNRFTGLNFTADHAILPARNILTWIAVICAVLFFVNVWRRGWMLPGLGLGLLVLSAVLIGMIWPGIVQQFQVNPSEPDKEAPYIQKNIEATRKAYGIDGVVIEDYGTGTSPLLVPQSPADPTKDAANKRKFAQAAVDNPGIRLVDPKLVQPLFEQKQQVRGYYSVADVLDVDRYDIPDGSGQTPERDLVLGVRELNQDGLPASSKNWANLHTVYTHGYGVIAAYGNQRPADNKEQISDTDNDDPAWAETSLPPRGQLTDLTPDGYEGRIYFGEQSPDYSIVGKAPSGSDIELDLPGNGDADAQTTTTYDGAAGVDISGIFHKVLFAMRYGDANLILSGRVHENSKILYHRNPRDMVEKVAPWLTVDEDPFPAVVDGRIVWVLDGFTTTDRYPLSQQTSFEEMTTDALAQNTTFQTLPTDEINYMRNAVKATVDAYDGTVKLYAWDESDPILQAWAEAFPGTVLPKSEIPEGVLAHMRYPEDLFKVQRYQLATYHVTQADEFYERSDQWDVPVDPDQSSTLQPPYRLSVETPSGDNVPTFSLTSVYVPYKRQNLAAFLSVDGAADQDGYGTLRVLRLQSSDTTPGPSQVANKFRADENIQNVLLPFTRTNAKAEYGNLLTLPVSGGLLYVQPLYVKQESGSATYPVLRFVLVAQGNSTGIGATLEEAVYDLLGITPDDSGDTSSPPSTDNGGSGGGGGGDTSEPPSGSLTQQVRTLLTQASADYEAADAALKAGDLQEYADRTAAAEAKVAKALELLNGDQGQQG